MGKSNIFLAETSILSISLQMVFRNLKEREIKKYNPPPGKADSLGVWLDFMKERQHHRKEYADWSELLRSVYLCRILTSTKLFR